MLYKDKTIAGIIGLFTGFIAAVLIGWLQLFDVSLLRLFLVLPLGTLVIFIAGIYLGKFLAQWWSFFDYFARFVIIGFSSTAIDFGIFNTLIFITGITKGVYFPFIRLTAVVVAFINSYFWNKFWTFRASSSGGGKKEFIVFAIVVTIGTLLNVGIASVIVNFITPITGVSSAIWANIASIIGIAIALFWNFIGMKFLVFKVK